MSDEQANADQKLQNLIGELVFWCGRIEHQLLRVLAHVLFSKNLDDRNFELVFENFKKTPINILCNTLLMLNKLNNLKISEDHVKEIKFYYTKTADIRNKIVHSYIYIEGDCCVCKNIGNFNDGKKDTYWPSGLDAIRYKISEINEHITRTKSLNDALNIVALETWKASEV